MKFVIYSDNGGQFHWRLDDAKDRPKAFSGTAFTSAADARRAAAEIHKHAGAASGTER